MTTMGSARNVQSGKRAVLAGRCLALGLLAFAVGCWAASTPIYKCLDKNLSLLYTDVPCKDGEQLDIRSGDADPGAVARLERQWDALGQSADQRAAEERRALVADSAPPPRYESGGDAEAGYDNGPPYTSDYDTPSYWLTQYLPMHPRKPKTHHMRHVAPRPPYIVPRP